MVSFSMDYLDNGLPGSSSSNGMPLWALIILLLLLTILVGSLLIGCLLFFIRLVKRRIRRRRNRAITDSTTMRRSSNIVPTMGDSVCSGRPTLPPRVWNYSLNGSPAFDLPHLPTYDEAIRMSKERSMLDIVSPTDTNHAADSSSSSGNRPIAESQKSVENGGFEDVAL